TLVEVAALKPLQDLLGLGRTSASRHADEAVGALVARPELVATSSLEALVAGRTEAAEQVEQRATPLRTGAHRADDHGGRGRRRAGRGGGGGGRRRRSRPGAARRHATRRVARAARATLSLA